MPESLAESPRAPGLRSIRVEGFRSLRLVELEVRPINVLIGANGSGKTNLLDVFSMLAAIRQGTLRRWVALAGGAGDIVHFGADKTDELSIALSFDDDLGHQYELTLSVASNDGLVPTWEGAGRYVDDSGDMDIEELPAERGEAGISAEGATRTGDPADHSPAAFVARQMDRWRKHHFHDTGAGSPLLATARLHDNRSLRGDGANLAAFLYRLSKTHPSRYDMILKTIRLVAPFLGDFRLRPMALNESTIRLEWAHRNSPDFFDVSLLSGGTLRFIALTTALLQPSELRPRLILLAYPEFGLHPTAVDLLAALIRQAAGTSRIIVATHSPILLDYFEPEDTVVVERRHNETILLRKTTEELRPWLEDFSLGELWEQNELGGRPGGEYPGG